MGFIGQIYSGVGKPAASPLDGSHARSGQSRRWRQTTAFHRALMLSACFTASLTGTARAQEALPEIQIGAGAGPSTAPLGPSAPSPSNANGDAAEHPRYKPATVSMSALGDQPLQDTPHSVNVITEDLLLNQEVKTVNDALRYLPSVIIRDQQGQEVSRPQSRGFQGSVVLNTRIDGMNIIGPTAYAAEGFSAIQVLNGPGGALYGPETPAGVFNYITKKPTDEPLFRYVESFDSNAVFTEQLDVGGRAGPDNKLGYRVNIVHGQGESYVQDSYANRTMFSGDFDYHFDNKTVVEASVNHYETNITGLQGSITYDGLSSLIKGNTSSLLPPAPNGGSILNLAQPGAGSDLRTDVGFLKFKHEFDNGWKLEVGGLYEDAVRNLYGLTNGLTNNFGSYSTVRNFTAWPHNTIASNEAALNGHVDLFGMTHDLTLGTNGYLNRQYSYRNTIAVTLGNGNLAVLPLIPAPSSSGGTLGTGGTYEAAYAFTQSIITADTVHVTDQLAIQGVLNTSFLTSRSFAVPTIGKLIGSSPYQTGSDTENWVLSPTASVIYKPIKELTTYFTYASSVEQGDTAPASNPTTGGPALQNPNAILAPYHDTQYEIGAKYAVTKDFLVTLAGFRMTRPLASTVSLSSTSAIFEVIGTQRNYGIELFGQGSVTPELSYLGGITWLDPRLQGTGNPTTDNMLVVGVPHWKSDMAIDYHPFFAHGFAFTGAVHYESDRAATDTNNSFAPHYATVDLGLRYTTTWQKHRATWRFQVLNVTNTSYFSSIADGNISGSPGANTAYVAPPRVFQTSLELTF